MSKGELVPQITLNALADPNEEWTLFEVAEILYRQFNQWLNLDLEHSGVSLLKSQGFKKAVNGQCQTPASVEAI